LPDDFIIQMQNVVVLEEEPIKQHNNEEFC